MEHLSELKRHDCAVNVVKFHPTEDILATASDGLYNFFKISLSTNPGLSQNKLVPITSGWSVSSPPLR